MRQTRHSPNRDMQGLCVEAEAAGWTVEKTDGGHLRITAPNGHFVFASQTPSDWRAVHATRARMRRAWPGWDRPAGRSGPRERPKRPGRSPEFRGAWKWDGVRAPAEQPIGATFADLWPRKTP